jgi:hypothetical protein
MRVVNWRMAKILVGVVLAAGLLGALAGTAAAKRPPKPGERSAIRTAWTAFLARPDSPAASDDRITKIWISTANTRYARINLGSPTVGPSTALLRKHASGWHVTQFGTSDFPCSAAPAKVWKDLYGAGFCV